MWYGASIMLLIIIIPHTLNDKCIIIFMRIIYLNLEDIEQEKEINALAGSYTSTYACT